MTVSPFFRLPLELREEVYFHYVFDPSGYHYDASSQKMRDAAGLPIDLALQYACKAIAKEMHGLALEHNTITFTTFEDKRADHLDQLLHWQEHEFWDILRRAPKCFTYDILQQLRRLHPDNYTVKYILNASPERRKHLVQDFLPWGAGQPSSMTRRVWHDLVRLTIRAPNFRFENGKKLSAPKRALIEWQPRLWLLPSHSELDSLSRTFFGLRAFSNARRFIRFHFSATTAAVTFLQSIGKSAQSHLRSIVINENRASVAHPESHAQGLIPYCRENPKLRVDHRASIWRTLLVHYSMLHNFYSPRYTHLRSNLMAWSATSWVITWIGEALLLKATSMPKSSYTLNLEGSSDLTQQIWDHLKRAAAAQEASWEMVRRGDMQLSNELFVNLGRPYLHIAAELPRAVREMIVGTSCVRLDAFKGELWDVDEVIATETRIRVKDWGQFFDQVELDQSDLEHGQAGLLGEFCVAPKPHKVPDTSLEDWDHSMEGFALLLGEKS